MCGMVRTRSRLFVALSLTLSLGCRADGDPAVELIDAAGRGDLAAVERLLADRADVRAVDRREPAGATALTRAARGAHCKVVERLLAAGADARHRLPDGATALHEAAATSHGDCAAAALLAAGADADATDAGGQTALHRAVAAQDLATVNHLLKAGADPDRKDAAGESPRAHALRRSLHPIARAFTFWDHQRKQQKAASPTSGATPPSP